MAHNERITRIQADRLAKELGFPPNTFFEKEELNTLKNAEFGKEFIFRGKTVTISPTMKAMANIILEKIIRDSK